MINPVCIVHMLYCSLKDPRAAKSFTCFTCSSHNVVMSELMSLRWDTGTAGGGRVASPESGHLAWPWLYQRMVAPFLFTGGSHQHTKHYKTTVHQWSSLTKELTTCFVPTEPPGEKIKRGNDGTLVGSVFLSLFQLRRSANVTSM